MIQITIHLLSIISGQLKPRFQGQELEAPSEKSQDQGAHFTRLVILTQVGTILLQKENLTTMFVPFMTPIIRMASKYWPFLVSKLNAPISQGFIDL